MANIITQEQVDASIKSTQYYNFPNSTVTICLITLHNGWSVTGKSSCIDPQNFNEEIGKQVAFNDAKGKIWQFLGYEKFLEIKRS